MGLSLRSSFEQIVTDDVGNQTDGEAVAAAVVRAGERISGRMAPLIGERSVVVLFANSLEAVRRRFRWPGASHISVADEPLSARIHAAMEHLESADAREAAVAVLVSFSERLELFVGERVLARVLRELWPDLFFDEAGNGDESPKDRR